MLSESVIKYFGFINERCYQSAVLTFVSFIISSVMVFSVGHYTQRSLMLFTLIQHISSFFSYLFIYRLYRENIYGHNIVNTLLSNEQIAEIVNNVAEQEINEDTKKIDKSTNEDKVKDKDEDEDELSEETIEKKLEDIKRNGKKEKVIESEYCVDMDKVQEYNSDDEEDNSIDSVYNFTINDADKYHFAKLRFMELEKDFIMNFPRHIVEKINCVNIKTDMSSDETYENIKEIIRLINKMSNKKKVHIDVMNKLFGILEIIA